MDRILLCKLMSKQLLSDVYREWLVFVGGILNTRTKTSRVEVFRLYKQQTRMGRGSALCEQDVQNRPKETGKKLLLVKEYPKTNSCYSEAVIYD